jgi:hypothetical protein
LVDNVLKQSSLTNALGVANKLKMQECKLIYIKLHMLDCKLTLLVGIFDTKAFKALKNKPVFADQPVYQSSLYFCKYLFGFNQLTTSRFCILKRLIRREETKKRNLKILKFKRGIMKRSVTPF